MISVTGIASAFPVPSVETAREKAWISTPLSDPCNFRNDFEIYSLVENGYCQTPLDSLPACDDMPPPALPAEKEAPVSGAPTGRASE